MTSQKIKVGGFQSKTCWRIEESWQILSNPPSTRSPEDEEQEQKYVRVLEWLKGRGIKQGHPEAIIENEEDKHKRMIAKHQHFKVERPTLSRRIKNISSLRVDINFRQSD